MPRSIELSVPPHLTGKLVERVRSLPGVAGVVVQPGAAEKPDGDVVRVTAANDAARQVLALVAETGLLDAGGSLTTSELLSVITTSETERLEGESSETIWEEAAYLLRRETNVSYNFLALMALSGAVAAAGLWSGAVHIVIGAMVIAPAFEPFVRVPLAVLVRERRLGVHGLGSIAAGWVALGIGAAVAAAVLRLMDPGPPTDLATRSLVRYWTTLSPEGIFIGFVAGAAGAVTVTAQRSVLSAGVMIALALVPSFAVIGMALALSQPGVAALGLGRWLWDAGLVLLAAFLVIGLKQILVHRRRALV